jgi:hypothetical protein
MTQNQYEQLAIDLQSLAKIVPLNWGGIQNDGTDKQINMFQIHSFVELERQTAALSENSRNYFRRRWFLWKSAQCDEHIFCMNNNVTANPNFKDQSYDIEFNNNSSLRFDVKGTVIPRSFRANIDEVIQDPSDMIKFYYDEQSKGVRNNHQNRLFVIHHSYRNQEREMYLRCHWAFKINIYKLYSEKVNLNSNFINYQNAKADVIFIFENLDKTISHLFFAVK